MSNAVTGPADLRDQQWLDEQVADLGRGIEAAQAIWANWWDGRQVGRLHPGLSPGDYIASFGMRLSLPEALAAMPDAPSRQIAAVAGVDRRTVDRNRGNGANAPLVVRDSRTGNPRVVRAEVLDVPVIDFGGEPAPASTDYEPLMAALKAVEAFTDADFRNMFDGMTPFQQGRAKASAHRAERVLKAMCRRFDAEVVELVVGHNPNED